MKDKRLEGIEQPLEFRARQSRPDWIYYPRLRMILGWGPGIRETLGKQLPGLRNVFIPEQTAITHPPLQWLLAVFDRHYLYTSVLRADITALREAAPQLSVVGAGAECISYGLLTDVTLLKTELRAPKNRVFPLSASTDHGVHYSLSDKGVTLTLVCRQRRLKEQYQRQFKQFASDQRRFSKHVTALKRQYVEKRVHDLEKDPSSRPLDFVDCRRAQARANIGQVQRVRASVRSGKMQQAERNGKVVRKQLYSNEVLLRRTCVEVARREANDQLYDFTWVDEMSLTPDGPVSFASQEPLNK